jgi:ribosomal protein S27AE
LKTRIYKLGLKKRECELCGQGEIWKGKKMSLILDHINGIWNDNRLENLRIVCPNCNATLETHCGKNLKKNKTLDDEISKKEQRKKNIYESGLKRRIVERPPYEELKKDIWINGYSAVGRKYGVSDNSVRKWIKNYEKNNGELPERLKE